MPHWTISKAACSPRAACLRPLIQMMSFYPEPSQGPARSTARSTIRSTRKWTSGDTDTKKRPTTRFSTQHYKFQLPVNNPDQDPNEYLLLNRPVDPATQLSINLSTRRKRHLVNLHLFLQCCTPSAAATIQFRFSRRRENFRINM